MVKAQQPYYFTLVNRTAYTITYEDKHGSDWPDNTKNNLKPDQWTLKPGQNSGRDMGILAASSLGTDQWGHLYFRVDGFSRPRRMIAFLMSENEHDISCSVGITENLTVKPTNKGDIGGGSKLGLVVKETDDQSTVILTGGDILIPFSLPDWMGQLGDTLTDRKDWALSRIKLPASHDSCTFGQPGPVGEISWRCQELALDAQMDKGIRHFDIRLFDRLVDGHYQFVPHHGSAEGTAPNLADSPSQIGSGTLADQLVRWAARHPREMVFIAITLDLRDSRAMGDFGKTISTHFGPLLAQWPEDRQIPSYGSVVAAGRNIILQSNHFGMQGLDADSQKLIDERKNWSEGWLSPPTDNINGTSVLYNDPTWQSNDCPRVIRSIEEYVRTYQQRICDEHSVIWGAQIQLTPSLFNPFGTSNWDDFLKEAKEFRSAPSISPRELARETNPRMAHLVPNSDLLQAGGNVISYDYAEEKLSSAIIMMNML